MYTSSITISQGSSSPVANGNISVTAVGTSGSQKAVMLVITTPWNSTAADSILIEGDPSSNTSSTIDYPSWGERVYIVKVLSIDLTAGNATFQVLSFVYDGRILLSGGGTNLISVTDNLPGSAAPGASINYDFTISNNSPSQIILRYIFATDSASTPTIKRSQSLPPITYGNKNCWYDDWATGLLACQDKTVGSGIAYHVTGSITTPSSGILNATLGIFVYVTNYWGSGKNEYVAPAGLQSGRSKTVTVDPCIGKVCSPDYICNGCMAYDAVCNPSNPTGPCIQGSRNISKDANCAFGYFSITSSPTGANIYIDGSLAGTTSSVPLVVQLSSGVAHNVTLSLAGYQDWNSGAITMTCGETVVINPTLTQSALDIYQLHIYLDSATTSTYVTSTINSFAGLLNNSLVSLISGVQINSVTYVQTTHEILVEMQQIQSLSLSGLCLSGLSPYDTQYHQYSPYYSQYYSQYSLELPELPSLDLPPLWVTFFLPLIPVFLWIPLFIVGYLIKDWSFIKKVLAPSTSNVIIKTCVTVSPTNCAQPCTLPSPDNCAGRDIIVEYNEQKQTATAANNYTVTFSNVPVTGVDKYPIKAYMPLSTGSNVYMASYEGFVVPIVPETRETISLAINHTSERNYTVCKKYTDNTNLEAGTVVVVYYQTSNADGSPKREEYGKVAIQADGCIPPVKVPSYYTDDMISTITISNSISPNAPSPLPQKGSETVIKRINEIKNTINVYTFSTNNNPITVDNIDIIDTSTNTTIKSIKPTDSYTMIDEIPKGSFMVEATMSGYKFSSCTNNCIVTFTSDYLQASSFTIVLESLVKTCDLTIYVLDKYGKPLKTIPTVSIDDGTARSIDVNKLEIKDIAVKDHKFVVTADKYKQLDKSGNPVTDGETRALSCTDTTTMEIFQMSQTDEIPIPSSMELTVNGAKGSVQVNKNKSVHVKVTGGDPSAAIDIKNISETPDETIATGTTGADGVYETDLTFSKDVTFEMQAFQGCACILGVCTCSKSSNIIELKVGAGSPECAIPNPLGGCLIEKTTGYGFMLLAGLGLIFGIMLFRPGGSAEKIIERYPAPSPVPSPKEEK